LPDVQQLVEDEVNVSEWGLVTRHWYLFDYPAA